MRVVLQARRHVVLLSAFALLAACDDDDDFTNIVVPLPVATTLTIDAASNNQTGVVGAALALPLVVRVFDAAGLPLPGAIVNWASVNGAGILSAASSITDANGDASVSYTLGTGAGAQSVTASIASGASATFNATATAGAFSGMNIVSGQNQIVQAGFLSGPMVVRAVDADGNPVAGVTIGWSASSGTLSALSSVTDANGLAEVTLLTNLGPGAAYVVTATVGTVFAQFNLAAQ